MRLERMQRDFLWGEGSLDEEPDLVKLSIVFFFI